MIEVTKADIGIVLQPVLRKINVLLTARVVTSWPALWWQWVHNSTVINTPHRAQTMNGILSVSQNITEAQMWDGTMLAAIVSIGRTQFIFGFLRERMQQRTWIWTISVLLIKIKYSIKKELNHAIMSNGNIFSTRKEFWNCVVMIFLWSQIC